VPNDPSPSPSPSDPPTSAPSEVASSEASATGSHSDSPPGFIADRGPAFDPDAAAEQSAAAPPRPPDPSPIAAIEWEQDTIESLLGLKGRALHAAIGVAEEDWHYTELDLAAIAPPLTRIANRYEPIQRLAQHADPLILLFALGGYGVRSLEERAAALRELEPVDGDELEEPIAAGPEPPRPQTAPRQTQPGPVQPPPAPATPAPAPQPPPRPAEAPIDPWQVHWEVGP
jgi:hypothetical protein